MSQQQLQRVKAIEKAAERHLSVAQAAELLHLSTRQVKRLKKCYDPDDAAWVYHGNRATASYLLERNGGPVETRTLDLYRVKVTF